VTFTLPAVLLLVLAELLAEALVVAAPLAPVSELPHAAAENIKGTAAKAARARRMNGCPSERRQIRVTLSDFRVGPG
jgi:hypothetical protein